MAITDHNIPASREDIAAIKSEFGGRIQVVPGIEIDTSRGDPTQMDDVLHILGYGVKDDGVLAARMAKVLALRNSLCPVFIKILEAEGLSIDIAEVYNSSKGEAPKARYDYFAAARKNPINWERLNRLGKTYSEQIDKVRAILAPNIPREYVLTPEEAITLVGKDGGKAVLAHPVQQPFPLVTPRFPNFRKNLQALIDFGLAGIECFHPAHSIKAIAGLSLAAGYYGLARTAGTDYHGNNQESLMGRYRNSNSSITFPLSGWLLNSCTWKFVESFAV